MPDTPSSPLLKRMPPGVWTVLVWCAATTYSLVLDEPPGWSRWALLFAREEYAVLRWPQLVVALLLVVCAGLPRVRPLPAGRGGSARADGTAMTVPTGVR